MQKYTEKNVAIIAKLKPIATEIVVCFFSRQESAKQQPIYQWISQKLYRTS